MKNLKWIFAGLFLLMGFGVSAQNNADELLKSVIDKTKSYSTMEVDFDYRMTNDEAGIDELKSGKVFVKGDAYKLQMAGQSVYCDGETVWTYLQDSEEVMVSDVNTGEESITPSSILTSYYNDYKISYVNNKENAEKGYKTIELKPEVGKKFSKIQIIIDDKKLQIVSFNIFDNGGNEFTYLIKKLIPNHPIDDRFFVFDPADFPDVEVVDMR